MPQEWIQILSVGINAGTLIGLAAVIRKFSRLEFKVELMWKIFVKKFGIDTDGESDEP